MCFNRVIPEIMEPHCCTLQIVSKHLVSTDARTHLLDSHNTFPTFSEAFLEIIMLSKVIIDAVFEGKQFKKQIIFLWHSTTNETSAIFIKIGEERKEKPPPKCAAPFQETSQFLQLVSFIVGIDCPKHYLYILFIAGAVDIFQNELFLHTDSNISFHVCKNIACKVCVA